MVKLRPLIAALMLANGLMPSIAAAQAYRSDLDAAVSAGSPRMKLFALMQARPQGGEELARGLQNSMGLLQERGASVISSHLFLSPVLEYDSNINGGTPGETIKIGNFLFTINPDSRAKSGLVAGVAPFAQMRIAMGGASYVNLSAQASAARALDYDLTRRSFAVDLCGAKYLGHADWLDICTGRRGGDRAMASGRENYVSLGYARQFIGRGGYFDASAKLQHVDNGTYGKTSLDFGSAHASGKVGLIEWRTELGQKIKGQHTRLAGATVSLTRPILGAQTTIFFSGAHEGGANFFGTPRWDDAFNLGLARNFGARTNITLSVQNRRSTLENYTGTTLDFNLRFDIGG